MSQNQIAASIGFQRGFFSDILNDKRLVGPKVAKRIAKYLGADDWRKFVHMPGTELRRILLPEKRISN